MRIGRGQLAETRFESADDVLSSRNARIPSVTKYRWLPWNALVPAGCQVPTTSVCGECR